MCSDCLAGKVGLSRSQVDGVLKSMASAIAIKTHVARCESCLKQAALHRLG